MHWITKLVLAALLFALAIQRPSIATTQEMTIRVKNGESTYIGRPLAHDGQTLALIRRDGRWTNVPINKATHIEKLSNQFQPYSSDAIRQKLQQEFGSKYQVSITSSFVVVHPNGDYIKWALPFEELYQRFRNYFLSRGMNLETPEFPMVAVVLRTRKEFDKFLRMYHQYDPNVLGYYSPRSNRIITYASSSSGANWFFKETLIHETTHQTAYNTGVHSRFNPTPRWATEGMAMMFEARGVNNSMNYSKRSDRVNKQRLAELKEFYEQGKIQGRLKSLIASDRLFRKNPEIAYPFAWGLTFFLAETYPREYFNFLQRDAKRKDFTDYRGADRLQDFAWAFGNDLTQLEQRMERFLRELE